MGDVDAMAEGTLFFPDKPILRLLAETRQLARRELRKLPDCLVSPGKAESGCRVEIAPSVKAHVEEVGRRASPEAT